MGELAEMLKSGTYKPEDFASAPNIVPKTVLPVKKQEKGMLEKLYFYSGLAGLEQITRVPGQISKGVLLETIAEGDGLSSVLIGGAKGAIRSLKGDFITRPEVQKAKGEVREDSLTETAKDIAYDLLDDSYLMLTGAGQAKLAVTAPFKAKALIKAAQKSFVPEIKGLGMLELVRGGLPAQRVLQQTVETQNLYQNTVRLKRLETVMSKEKHILLRKFLTDAGIYDKKERVKDIDKFEDFWLYAEHGHTMSPQDLAQISPEVKLAADGIRAQIGDVLHSYAKKTAPDLGYWVGHVPHYYAIGEHTDKWKKIETARKALPDIDNIHDLRNIQKIMRGKGGYFGSINKQRLAKDRQDYSRAYLQVMDNYIDGVYSKGFKDRFKPMVVDTANALVQKANVAKSEKERAKYESLLKYLWGDRDVAGYDKIVSGQAEIDKNIRWQAALANVPGIKNWEKPASKITDIITGFQYIAKLGVSYVRFPLVNLTQPILTTLPAVGSKAFVAGFYKAITGNKEYLDLCKKHGVFDPVMRAVSERGITKDWEKYLAIPQRASETWNRWFTFCAGMEQGRMQGKAMQAIGRTQIYDIAKGGLSPKIQNLFKQLKNAKAKGNVALANQLQQQYVAAKSQYKAAMQQSGGKLIETVFESPRVQHALDTVDLCQFAYFRHSMPAWFATSGFGKIAGQFRAFSSFYANFLMQMKRRGPADFAKALAALVGLSGLGFIPYYKYLREDAMRVGIELPNPDLIKETTKAAGIKGGISIGSSLEPFNPPQQTSWVLGPTWGPMAEAFFPGESDIGKVLEGISPPVSRLGRYLFDQKVYTDAEKARYLGDRDIVEALYLKPSFESRRYQILSQIEAATQGKRPDIVRKLIQEAKEEGIQLEMTSPTGMAGKDMATIKARIKKRDRMIRGKLEKKVREVIHSMGE